MTNPPTGHGFAKVFADAMSEALINAQAHGSTFAAEQTHANRIKEAEAWEQEAAQVLRERIGFLLDDDTLDEHTREQLTALLHPEHFVQLAAVMPAIIGIAWILGSAAMAGPASQLQTISMRNFGDVPYDVGMMLDAAARKRVPDSWPRKFAEDAGLDPERIDDLIKAQRSYPPVSVLAELVRRGKLTPGLMEWAVERSGMIEEYVPLMSALVDNIVPLELAFRAELQGNLDKGRVLEFMKLNGIAEENHDWIYETEGQPPPIQELIQLWRRGKVDAQTVHDAILEGPVKNKYIPAIMAMRDRIPPQETVIALTRRGVLTKPEGTQLLFENGFSMDLSTKMIAYADNIDDDSVRAETKAEIVGAYEASIITRDAALSMLTAIRFAPDHAEMVLDLADAKHARRLLNEGISKVRAGYIGWKFDEPKTVALLDALHVPSTMRDELLDVWDIERDAASKHLTPAQVIQLLKRGSIDAEGAVSRLRAAGYSAEDADLMLDLAMTPTEAKGTTT